MATVRNKTLTLNLSEREWAALEDMCQKTEMNKSQLLRHALAVYQSVKWPLPPIDRSLKIIAQNPENLTTKEGESL